MDELACFSEVSRQRAFERFELLRAHLEDGGSLAAIAREARLSYRTLQYRLERYRTSGPVATASSPPQAATFSQSLVVAAELGTVTIPSVNTQVEGLGGTSFGIGFRASTGVKGTVTIQGTVESPGFSLPATGPDFFYEALEG